MKGRPVFVGCVAVLVLTACGGAGVSAGSHPHTAVASSSCLWWACRRRRVRR